MTKALRFAAAALLMPLAACAGSPPWTLSQSPSEITLRWYANDTDIAAASAAATRHCASYGKAATLGELQRDGSAAIASYRCG